MDDQTATRSKVVIFRKGSWRFHEYRDAITSPIFRENIAQYLDAEATHSDPLQAKYFYAGSCARYMFE